MAATWQVAAALPGKIPQEHQGDLFEAVGALLKTPLKVKNGKLIVPQNPGIGREVDEGCVKKFSTEHWVVNSQGRNLKSA